MKIRTNIKKSGVGNGETVAKKGGTSAKARNPKEISGKGGSYASKKTATTPGGPIEINKGKARRSAVLEASYNHKKPNVKVVNDPSGTSHHPDMGPIFKTLRAKNK